MKRFFLITLLILSLAGSAQAAELSVPARVSQGHAFPVCVSDAAPFDAVFTWRGEQFRVNAVRDEAAPDTWKAQLLLAMPIDARADMSSLWRSTEKSAPLPSRPCPLRGPRAF